jgi:predicted cobalt transporter CbtA
MFRSIVLSACLAGLGSGVVLTIAQQPTVAPIILAAETYESARVAEPGAQAVGQQHGELHEPAREPSVAHQHQHEHAQKNSSATHLHDSEQAWVQRMETSALFGRWSPMSAWR